MEKDGIDNLHRLMFCRHLYREMNFASVQIPTEFLDQIIEEVPDTLTLRGPWGGSWPVKVHQKKEGIFFVEGWNKFLSDHSLVSGGFLLFCYCGNWRFTVEIFGHDGLEKIKIRDGGEKSKTSPSGFKGKRVRPGSFNFGSLKDQVPKSRRANSGVLKNIESRASWKCPQLLEFFLDLCMEEAAVRRTEGGNLSRKSWNNIQWHFKVEKGIDLTIVQLENHWSFLKRKYVVWSQIIAQAGNGQYDPVENKVNWDEKQWEEYEQLHPEARVFRSRLLEYPEKMKILFDTSEQCTLRKGVHIKNNCKRCREACSHA